MDNVFLISKLKFKNFQDNKSFAKVLEDILYQISKQLNLFIFRSIINIFETMRLGHFDNDSMIFFIKILLTFYYTHMLVISNIEKDIGNKEKYDINFKNNFEQGFNDMKGMVQLIPLVELIINKDEELIYTVMRIDDIDNKNKQRPNSTKIRNGELPPIKTNKIKGLNINEGIKMSISFKGEENKLNNSSTEHFFKTEVK